MPSSGLSVISCRRSPTGHPTRCAPIAPWPRGSPGRGWAGTSPITAPGVSAAIQLYGSDADGGFSESSGGTGWRDGQRYDFGPGETLLIGPGESVTLMPGDWHKFWGEGGDVLIGEVSTGNDDLTDNIFRDPIGRFSEIEEDEAPTHLLVSDYDRWLS